jgi:hypothetical protein
VPSAAREDPDLAEHSITAADMMRALRLYEQMRAEEIDISRMGRTEPVVPVSGRPNDEAAGNAEPATDEEAASANGPPASRWAARSPP